MSVEFATHPFTKKPFQTVAEFEEWLSEQSSLVDTENQQIYVYTSSTEVTICKGNDVCSADPILPDFSFKVKDLFAEGEE